MIRKTLIVLGTTAVLSITAVPSFATDCTPSAEVPAWDEVVVTSPAWEQEIVTEWDEDVVVTEAYDEQVVVTPAWDEEFTVSEAWSETIVVAEAGWQRYSWTGGPIEEGVVPSFPDPNWQPNVKGDPHGVGVEGAYDRSHGSSGNADWFYLERVPAVTEVVEHPAVVEVRHHEAVTDWVAHPAVVEVVHRREVEVVVHPEVTEVRHHEAIPAVTCPDPTPVDPEPTPPTTPVTQEPTTPDDGETGTPNPEDSDSDDEFTSSEPDEGDEHATPPALASTGSEGVPIVLAAAGLIALGAIAVSVGARVANRRR